MCNYTVIYNDNVFSISNVNNNVTKLIDKFFKKKEELYSYLITTKQN